MRALLNCLVAYSGITSGIMNNVAGQSREVHPVVMRYKPKRNQLCIDSILKYMFCQGNHCAGEMASTYALLSVDTVRTRNIFHADEPCLEASLNWQSATNIGWKTSHSGERGFNSRLPDHT